MEPIRPIEGISNSNQSQGNPINQVIYENYWQKRAKEKASNVEASGDATGTANEHHPAKSDEEQVKVQMSHTYAEFEIDKETREVLVRIIDAESGELVRSIPPEKLAEEIAKGKLYPHQLKRRAVLV
ncbi:MAG: flagellar protein FlaG [Anaerolineae bacterium]|nr:flagellar protein FlaG [Anaerolineae bacterium]